MRSDTRLLVCHTMTLLVVASRAQFTQVHIGPAGSSLEAIHLLGSGTGYAAGKDGALLKSIDGGLSWNTLSSGSGAYLFGVSFLDPVTGYTSGGGATLLKTADGGDTWSPLALPFTECAYQVQPMNDTLVYSGGWGGYFFRSTNSGADWSISSVDPDYQGWIFAMRFLNNDTGYVAGADGRIYRTVNSGLDWSQQPTPTTNMLRAISFGDAHHGFAAGFFGTLLMTVDAGANWTTVDTGYPGDSYYGVHFTDALHGVLCGGFYSGGNWQGAIMRTDDGGGTWTRIHTGGPVLNGITISDGHVFAVGVDQTIITDAQSVDVGAMKTRALPIAHPNPANEQVFIDLPSGDGPWSIRVVDARGVLVHDKRMTGQQAVVEVSGWPTGTYALQVTKDKRHSMGRITVTH